MSDYIARSTPWGTIQTGRWFKYLTPLEQNAVLEHERGHIVKRHALKRLLWMITLRAFFNFDGFLAMCEQQEFEADRYACTRGHRDGMISFLFCRQFHPKTPGYPSPKERLEALNV